MPSRDVNPQLWSPLFARLPAELRTLIYQYALTRYEDPAREQWRQDTAYYRPGFTGPKRLASELLLSCRKIYLEARLMAVAINQHSFWFEWSSRRPFAPDPNYFEKLTPEQQRHVDHVHLFSQMFFVEDGRLGRFFSGPAYRPNKLTLTFRHADMWGWEGDNEILHFENPDWYQNFRLPISVETFIVEFETVAAKKNQLDDMVQKALDWKFTREDDVQLSPKRTVKASTWDGALLSSATVRQHGLPPRFRPMRPRFRVDEELKPVQYYVVEVTWRVVG